VRGRKFGDVPPAEFEKAYHDRQAAPVGRGAAAGLAAIPMPTPMVLEDVLALGPGSKLSDQLRAEQVRQGAVQLGRLVTEHVSFDETPR
jgi:hypothetical protein